MNTRKKGMFEMDDGRNLIVTFALVSSLFFLWAVCNGMIDVMDKHFQTELGLSKSQSAWVQFSHYLGYFLMSMPAGMLASRFGYKWGIIAGLLMVAVGGFWFLPATHINALARVGSVSPITAFVGYLVGVCAIAAGLTFLETVANPYTTVLGPKQYAAARINLAQSCNGLGWVFGPIIGGIFFYSKDASGRSTGSETLYIPYVIVAVIVLVLAVVFYFSYIPDIKTEDDYHLDDSDANVQATTAEREVNRGLVYFLLLLNSAVLVGIFAMILSLILSAVDYSLNIVWIISGLFLAIAATALIPVARKISHHSVWTHPHFSSATLTQFFYVAAQAGIFSFFINSMTSDARTGFSMVPPIPASWNSGVATNWIEVNTTFSANDIIDLSGFADKLKQKPDALSSFLSSNLSGNTIAELANYNGPTSEPKSLLSDLIADLNKIVKQDPDKVDANQLLYDPARFSKVNLSEKTQQLLARKAAKQEVDLAYLNRALLHDAYPQAIAFNDSLLCISDKGAANLASVAFFCFLLGRFTGAGLLKKVSAHKILGLYGLLNVIICFLIFLNLGWVSVLCIFLSYFFMSVMFPTIFALGIFGLGARAKKAAAYIVMAIMGGAILPKLMGYVADKYDMSRGFIVPLFCFAFVALYAYSWPKLSKSEGMHITKTTGGH